MTFRRKLNKFEARLTRSVEMVEQKKNARSFVFSGHDDGNDNDSRRRCGDGNDGETASV